MNNKAQMDFINKVYLFLVIFIVLALIIAGFFAASIAFPIVAQTGNSATALIGESVPRESDNNATIAYNSSFVSLDKSLKNLQWISYLILFGLLIVLMIFAYEVKGHPMLLPIWLALGIILVFVAIVISSSYYDAATSYDFSYDEWRFNDYICSFLPVLVVGFVVIGGLALFALSRNSEIQEVGL